MSYGNGMNFSFLGDRGTAVRIDRCEGYVNAVYAEVRVRLNPVVGSGWCEHGGTTAIFDGPTALSTHTFGLGLGDMTEVDWAKIEDFYRERSSPTVHKVSTLAAAETFGRLSERGYRMINAANVLVQRLDRVVVREATGVRRAEPSDENAWVEAAVRGFGAPVEALEALSRGMFHNASMAHFLVETEGRIVATGSVGVHQGVALIAGGSTVPEFRGRGAQAALLAARLDYARSAGCELAAMSCSPGSPSHRNGLRAGFEMVYSRLKWRKELVYHLTN